MYIFIFVFAISSPSQILHPLFLYFCAPAFSFWADAHPRSFESSTTMWPDDIPLCILTLFHSLIGFIALHCFVKCSCRRLWLSAQVFFLCARHVLMNVCTSVHLTSLIGWYSTVEIQGYPTLSMPIYDTGVFFFYFIEKKSRTIRQGQRDQSSSV